MNRYGKEYIVHLSDSDRDVIAEKAKAAGITNREFVHRAVNDMEVSRGPDCETAELIRQVRRSGRFLEEMLEKSGTPGDIREDILFALEENRAAERAVLSAYGV